MDWKRAAITAVIAYGLALQAILLPFGGLRQAQSAPFEHGIICLQDAAGQARDDAESRSKPHGMLCCTWGCFQKAAFAGPIPPFALIPAFGRFWTAAGPHPVPAVLASSLDVLPLGARAPPRLG